MVSSETVVAEHTGLVHSAPGHGPEDFELGQKLGLPAFSPVDARGHFTEDAGAYAGQGYGSLKSDVAQALAEFVTPLRQAVAAYTDDPAELDKLLARGAERAREVAAETVRTVYDRVGFLPPTG